MEITRVKHWKKVVKGETVDHVQVAYKEGDKDLSLHQYGERATAAPEFYSVFEKFSPLCCAAAGLPDSLANGVKLTSISIAFSEDKEGNENTSYSMTCTLKAGHASATLNISTQHKFIPEGFEEAVNNLIEEAEQYVGGKRAQTELKLEQGADQSAG